MGLLVLVAIGGVIGGLVVAEIGPFAPEEKPQVKRKKPKPRKKKVVKKPAPIPGEVANQKQKKEAGAEGLVQTENATLAEIDGYRAAIGGLEQKKDALDAAGKAD